MPTAPPTTPPPDRVQLSDVLDLLATAPELATVIGIGADGEVVTVPLDGECPHVLVSGDAGGGNTVALRTLVAQLMRHGAHVSVLDRKRHSHKWIHGLPGVEYYRETQEIHDALVALGREGERRAMRAQVEQGEQVETVTIVDSRKASQRWVSGPDFDARHVIVLEEANATIRKLNDYWTTTRDPETDPKESPAIRALLEILFMGRAVNMLVLTAGHWRPPALAIGAPEARAIFGTRILLRYTQQQAQTLAPEVELPRASRRAGRAQVVQHSSQAHETQVVFFTEDEARMWATGANAERCFYCGGVFWALPGHDPLRKHVEHCEARSEVCDCGHDAGAHSEENTVSDDFACRLCDCPSYDA